MHLHAESVKTDAGSEDPASEDESFFDRTLRREDELAGVIVYVINNPVRAGLVETPAEYRYWGSQRYSRDEILEFVQMGGRRRV